ncbi:hypothetical protein LIA77_09621 [Sarocladium implicatum]|nr:hypothetical protein LIA77_09621 [Sarocladium implicatum]
MAPETRSRGVPPPSRVYNSTPSLQQVYFPSRRKSVRFPRSRESSDDESNISPTTALRLKQQTLTQLDFVHSSFEEEIEFDDSEKEEMARDESKENKKPNKMRRVKREERDEEEDESDEQPVSGRRRKRKNHQKGSGEKRRRTLDDGEVKRLKAEDEEQDRRSRWSTLSDVPSSRYHTQTLTQFVGRDHYAHLVLDSDDELPNANDHDFDAWLGGAGDDDDDAVPASSPVAAAAPARQDSVVPQTPTKPIRTEVPSSSQQVTPLSGIMLERYGAPDVTQASPSAAAARRGKIAENVNAGPTPVSGTPVARRKLVVEDSFASDGVFGTPSKRVGSQAVAPVQTEIGSGLGLQGVVEIASSTPGGTPTATPTAPRRQASSPEAGKKSSVKRVRISSASPLRSSPRKHDIADGRDEIPDSEDDDEDFELEEPEEDFAAGEETQLALDQMAGRKSPRSLTSEVTITSSPPLRRIMGIQQAHDESTATEKHQSENVTVQTPKRLRKPLPPPAAATQPFESQRLPTALVQSFPPAVHHTDAIIPLPPTDIDLITSGYRTSVTLPYRVVDAVLRFWFWDGAKIQFGATRSDDPPTQSSEGGERVKWEYHLPQVYELNDPMDEAELKASDISCKSIVRYGYMPPSIASGMLWNLGRALFADSPSCEELERIQEETEGEDDDDDGYETTTVSQRAMQRGRTPASTNSAGMTISQEVEAQLKSDIAHSTQFVPSDEILVPSTPEEDRRPTPLAQHPQKQQERHNSKELARNVSTIRPSQATTASQCSTPSPTKAPRANDLDSTPIAFRKGDHEPAPAEEHDISLPVPSSSSLTFQDYSAPSPLAPHMFMPPVGMSSSQLLSKSQMLPDSLLRDNDHDDEPAGT